MKKIFNIIAVAAVVLAAACTKTVQGPDVVVPAAPTEFSLNESSLVMYVGETYQLQTAMIEAVTKAHEDVEFESSNPDAVLVSDSGLLTALKKGSATITATYEGVKQTYTATCEVTVSVDLTSIKITPDVIDVNLGDADVEVSVVAVPDEAEIDAAKVEWFVADPSVATFADGKLHPLKGGATTLTASYRGFDATVNVVVRSEAFKGMLPYMKNNCFPIEWKSDVSNLTAATMECLVYAKGYEGLSTLFGKEGEWLVRYGDVGYKPGQLQLALSGNAGGNFPDASQSPDLAKNCWYHVAAVWDATTGQRTFYINGENRVSDTGAKGSVNLTSDCYVGFSYDDGRFFDGYMSEMRIWNVARTEQQILDNMLSLKEENPQGLLAYWKFNESTGDNVKDYSGNENNITSKSPLVWENAGEIVLPKRFTLSSEGLPATVALKQDATEAIWKISADEDVTWTAAIESEPEDGTKGTLTTSGDQIKLTFPANNTDNIRKWVIVVSTNDAVEHPTITLKLTHRGNTIVATAYTGEIAEGRYVIAAVGENWYGNKEGAFLLNSNGSASSLNLADEASPMYFDESNNQIVGVEPNAIWKVVKDGDAWHILSDEDNTKGLGGSGYSLSVSEENASYAWSFSAGPADNWVIGNGSSFIIISGTYAGYYPVSYIDYYGESAPKLFKL